MRVLHRTALVGLTAGAVVAALAVAPSAASANQITHQASREQINRAQRFAERATAARTSPAALRERQQAAAELTAAKRTIAQRLAAALADPGARRAVRTRLRVDPHANVVDAVRSVTAHIDAANARVLALKGVPESAAQVLEAKLWDASMARAVVGGATPLVAFRPAGEDRSLARIDAFDRAGKVRSFPAKAIPSVPVLVVDLDATAINRAVFGKVRATLAQAGVVLGEVPAKIPARTKRTAPLAANAAAATASYTVIERARLGANGDAEAVGDAEIYSFVIGVGKDDQPRVDTVWMPWLTNDRQLYAPAQPVVDWSHFKHDAVSLVMMEQDGTNYKDVVMAVVTAIGAILDFALPYIGGAASLVANIVNAIIRALPDEWFIDDDDYADAWYLITRNGGGLQFGAVRDSWLSLNRHDVVGGVDVAAPLGGAPVVAQSFVIESELTSNQVLDSGEKQPVQWTLHGGLRQQWKVQDATGDTVNLVSLDTGKCLDFDAAGAVAMATCSGEASQRWRFTPSGADVYTLTGAGSGGKVLSVLDGATAEGAGLVVTTNHNFLSQHWRFVKISK